MMMDRRTILAGIEPVNGPSESNLLAPFHYCPPNCSPAKSLQERDRDQSPAPNSKNFHR